MLSINPNALFNEIMNGILSNIPGGQAVRQAANQQNRSVQVRPQSSTTSPQTALLSNRNNGIGNVSFEAILEHFANDGENSNALLRQAIDAEIEAAASRHNLDPNLVRAVVRVESNYRHDAVSHAGAMGLMQLMPRTAESLGVTDPFDIRQNLDGGTRYLRRMLDMFDGDISLALAAYNAGAGAVRRHGGIPPFRETQNHVPRVLEHKERYAREQYLRAIEDSRNT